MQQQTHPAGFYRLWAVPLTLLAQPAASTVYDPSGVEYPQRAIGLGALLGRVQRLACWTTERPIGLESKVLSREAASFPGGGGGGCFDILAALLLLASVLLNHRPLPHDQLAAARLLQLCYLVAESLDLVSHA
jgi:hypothetical protein